MVLYSQGDNSNEKILKDVFALLGMGGVIVATFAVAFSRTPNFIEVVVLAIFQAFIFMAIWGGLTD